MTPKELIDSFETLAEAQGGIAHLRRLVLRLAARGKLVPQDAGDEPAMALLQRLEIAKETWRERNAARRARKLLPVSAGGAPHPIPATWVWCRLGQLANPQAGFAFKSRFFNEVGEGLPLIRIRDVLSGRTETFYSGDYRSEFVVRNGDYLVGMDGNFNIGQWNGGEALLNQRVTRLQWYSDEVAPRYAVIALQHRLDELHGVKAYTTVQHLSGKQIEDSAVPLPPVPEQQRIVRRVDELMALLDRLEAAQHSRESTRQSLRDAALSALRDARTLNGIGQTWSQCSRFLPDISAEARDIEELRGSIRGLAIRGCLSHQDQSEDGAERLLDRIAREKEKLVREKKVRRRKKLAPIDDSELPFEIPEGWRWCRLEDLLFTLGDGPHYSPKYVDSKSGIPFLSTRNITASGFRLDDIKHVSPDDHASFCERVKPEPGDVLYTKGGTTGIALVNDLNFEFSVWVHVAVLKIARSWLDPRYIALALNAPHCYEQSQRLTHGTGNRDLGLTRMVRITIPLPPLAEQHRIVSEVDRMFSICDQLESALVKSEKSHKAFAESAAAIH